MGWRRLSPVLLLEQVGDERGSAFLGWLGERVLFSRFERAVSAELGRQFACRFTALMGDTVAVRYFSDYSDIESYDIGAFPLVFDAMFAKRNQLERVTLLPWRTQPSEKARAKLDSIGCVEYAASAADFEARLGALVPGSTLRSAATWSASGVSPYTYVFDLADFESGRFTATRVPHLSSRPRGTWICVARSDEQALRFARQAALSEWARPRQRRPEDFTVQFLDSLTPPALRG